VTFSFNCVITIVYIYVKMPSEFIVSQSELLYKTNDVFLVLQNLRDKYTISSFPSQMSRVKDEWFKYKDYSDKYSNSLSYGLKYLKKEGISSKFIDQYITFGNDDMKTQLKKRKLAEKQNLTGSSRTDRTISEIPILPTYMDDYKLTKTDSSNANSSSSKNLEERSKECIQVKDCDKLLEKCHNIVKNLENDVFLTAAALSVLCGRRSIEILKTGVFNPSKNGAYSCLFSGMAKKRSCDGKECPIDIPLLIKYKYVEKCIEYIRSIIDVQSMSNTEVNSKYSHRLGDASKILMDTLNVRFHDLRAMYGNITHETFENTWSINIWLKKVLIHDTIDTSLFYSRCKIENCNLKLGEWRERSK